ncbi:hypothetical protein BMS3Abin04_02718 [bacterium BMS3Abin04]|nr:hypothetical protein BMS3Abin04_02718 [bacterium BMS3Abin04]
MKTKYIKLFIIIVLTTAFIQSCVPAKESYEEEILPADRLIKKLEANRRKVKTFQGNGVFSVDSPKLNAKASFEVKLKKPDSLQFSIYGPFGIDLAQVLITKSDYIFYDVIKNKIYKGPLRDAVVKRFFKIDISFDNLMDAFTGAVNLTDKLRKEPNIFNVDGDSYLLTYIDSVRHKKNFYQINTNDLAITEYKLIEFPNRLLFEGQYSDFKRYVRNVPIPRSTRIFNKAENQKVDINYRNIKINDYITSMKLNLPDDASVIQW